MELRDQRKSGFTLVEMMIVVAVIGLLAAIAIPNFVRARTTSQTNACINNLRQIDAAKQEWGTDHKVPATARPGIAELQPYLGRGINGLLPTCPLDQSNRWDTSYIGGNLQTTPVCKQSPTNHILM